MVAANFLIARFNIAFDHKTFHQSMKFRVYLAAVENFFGNTNLLIILLVRVGMVGVYNDCRVF